MADIDKVIEDNLGLVYAQLHKFNRAYDEDAYSYALEALWNAAKTYDNSQGVAFSTYASVCIYNGIAGYLREQLRESKKETISLEEPVTDDEEVSLVDVLRVNITPETMLLEKELNSIIWEKFYKVLNSITNANTIRTIEIWKNSGFKAKQLDIAKELNLSQSQVSRTISAFRYKLKKEMEDYLC